MKSNCTLSTRNESLQIHIKRLIFMHYVHILLYFSFFFFLKMNCNAFYSCHFQFFFLSFVLQHIAHTKYYMYLYKVFFERYNCQGIFSYIFHITFRLIFIHYIFIFSTIFFSSALLLNAAFICYFVDFAVRNSF